MYIGCGVYDYVPNESGKEESGGLDLETWGWFVYLSSFFQSEDCFLILIPITPKSA